MSSFFLINTLFVLVITISGFWIGFWVYLANRKSKINQTFLLMTLCSTLWIDFAYFGNFLNLGNIAQTWAKLGYGMATLFLIPFYFFSKFFPKEEEKESPLLNKAIITICVFLFLLSVFTNSLVKDVETTRWGIFPVTGPGKFIYFSGIFLMALFIASRLFIKYSKLTKEEGVKTQYFLVGLFIFVTANLISNVILPFWQKTPRYYYFGNYSAIFLLGLTAYAIVKYRFLNIRVALGQIVAHLLSAATIISAAFLLAFLNNRLENPLPFTTVAPFIAILSILLFQLTQSYKKIIAKYFYPAFHNAQIKITDLEKRLTQVLELKTLSSLIVNALRNTLNIEKIGILTKKIGEKDWIAQQMINFSGEELSFLIKKDDFPAQYLVKIKKPIVREELTLVIEKAKDREKEEFQKLQENMKRIGAVLCLPLIFKKKLIGVIALGNKASGEPFFAQDIELLTTLSRSATIALKNASLYAEVKNRKEELERFYKTIVDRELKMVELRKKIIELETQLEEKDRDKES